MILTEIKMPAEPKNKPMAFHLCRMKVSELLPVAGHAADLPPTLVIPPGRYRVHGKSYALKRQGLYRFLFPGHGNQQRIVYQDDVPSLLSAICWICSHGSRDNKKSHQELCGIAMAEKLIVTCGDLSQFALELFAGLGLPSRRVGSTTLQALNTYDNGHQTLEVWLDGRWTLVDLDMKRMFHRRGKRLNLPEFCAAAATGDFSFEPISAATPLAVGLFKVQGYDYGLWMETAYSNDAALRAWYQRVMMVPIQINQDSCFTVFAPGDRRRFERLYPNRGHRFLSPEEFYQKFYSQPPVDLEQGKPARR